MTFADVAPQFGLELEIAFVVAEEVLGETRPVLRDAHVDLVVRDGGEEVTNGREDGVEVVLVLAVVELTTVVADLAALSVALVLEDKAGLEEALKMSVSE